MPQSTFITAKELFVGEIAQPGQWVVGCVRSGVGWPFKLTPVLFRTRKLYLLPVTVIPEHNINTHPAVAVRLEDQERYRDGQVLISHFLSSLAWSARQPVEVTQWTGGGLPRSMGGYHGDTMMTDWFSHKYLPDPADPNARLALGLYREGMYLNHVAYQCLSYFKILNIFLRNGSQQIAWIDNNLSKVGDQQAKRRIESLGTDVGQFLYGSNRCAIAHAGGTPTADPENPEDMAQLRDDLPLVRALAEIAIEEHFAVKSATTIWREHHYELEGFREIFGRDRTEAIKNVGTLPEADWPSIPKLSVRLEDHDKYEPLEGMTAEIVEVRDGMAVLECRSANALTLVRLCLDFTNERMRFDAEANIASKDNKSALSARYYSRTLAFRLDYFLNGALEVWDAEAEKQLSRRDPFMPQNVDMNETVRSFRNAIEQVDAEAGRRAVSEGTVRPNEGISGQ
jgi:hypothetical protein